MAETVIQPLIILWASPQPWRLVCAHCIAWPVRMHLPTETARYSSVHWHPLGYKIPSTFRKESHLEFEQDGCVCLSACHPPNQLCGGKGLGWIVNAGTQAVCICSMLKQYGDRWVANWRSKRTQESLDLNWSGTGGCAEIAPIVTELSSGKEPLCQQTRSYRLGLTLCQALRKSRATKFWILQIRSLPRLH